MEPCKIALLWIEKISIGVFFDEKINKKMCPKMDKMSKRKRPQFTQWTKGGFFMIKVSLKDGSILEVEKGTTIIDVAKKISEGLARVATCGEIDGEVKDLRYELQDDCSLVIHTFKPDDLEGKKAYWHTTSHIMDQAVQRLFPDVKFAIGPAIDEGFYYDFDVEKPFTDEDKENIEAEMKKIIKKI